AAWGKYLKRDVEIANSIGMKFRLIPPSTFMMGSTREQIAAALKIAGESEFMRSCVESEGPEHPVILTQPVYVGIHEVTQAQYQAVMGTNPSHNSPQVAGKDNLKGADSRQFPVEQVSWTDACEFCIRLSSQEKLT